MNKRLLLLIITLILFASYTLYSIAISPYDFAEYINVMLRDHAAIQIVIDLYIAMGIFIIWMIKDFGSIGLSKISLMIYILLTVFLGVIGPLCYLIHREVKTTQK